MFITKTLALPHLDRSDCLKILFVRDTCRTELADVLRGIMNQEDLDISDDELLAHLCVRKGFFSFRDWQRNINRLMSQIAEIDRDVDPAKRLPSLEETVYLMSGSSGRISGGGYKMLCALCARDLVFENAELFKAEFGAGPREFAEAIWTELDGMLKDGIISGEYTHELMDLKYPKKPAQNA